MKKFAFLFLAFFAVAIVACNNDGGNDEEGDRVADSLSQNMMDQIRAEQDSLAVSGDTTVIDTTDMDTLEQNNETTTD